MLSVRLPPEQEANITQIVNRLGISRSAWLRQIIDQGIAQHTTVDPHLRYLELMVDVPRPLANNDNQISHRARNHSAVLKTKLQAQRTVVS